MFHMAFQSTLAECSSSSEAEDESTGGNPEPAPTVVVYEGRVGKFGRIRRLPHPGITFPHGVADDHSSSRSVILSPVVQWAPEEPASLKSDIQQAHKEPPRTPYSSEAMTQVIDKLMQERKRTLKPWEEPLLAAQNQEEQDLMAKEEAEIEAERLAEGERWERQRQLRELCDLAHYKPVTAPSQGRSDPSFKKSKQKILKINGVCRLLRSSIGIFRSNKKHTEYPDAREAKVIITKGSLFGGYYIDPSSGTALDSQLATMRIAQESRISTQTHFEFATVESTQRDVPAWTREEYLRRNGRLPKTNEEDEEFGGIEGNNLFNQYFDNGIETDDDSDSD